MSIQIQEDRCISCGLCTEACPGNLISLDTESSKAKIRHPRDCWGCTSCIKECPVQAIRFFLGMDIGGTGSQLSVQREESISQWTIQDKKQREKTITVNAKDANRY